MYLQLRKGNKTHLSHFHHFVSAYVTNDEMVKELEQSLKDALEKAKKDKEMVIVEQDCLEHIFVVYPSGTIGLYREVGVYEVYEE